MNKLTKKDLYLKELLSDLECKLDDNYTQDQKLTSIAITVLAAKECGVTDKAIEIIESNKDKSYHEINHILYISERIFPELEIVDDNELEDDEK